MRISIRKTVFLQSAALLLPCLLEAKESVDAELSLGVIGYDVDNPSAQFGRYSGISDENAILTGSGRLNYTSDDYYLYLGGINLGQSPSLLEFEGGSHGTYKLSLDRRHIDTLMGVDAKTPYAGTGSDMLSLPDSFVTAADTADMTTLADSLKIFSMETERYIDRAGLTYTPTERWQITLDAYRNTREGEIPLGGSIGIPGRWGYPAVILPSPVDETIDILRVTAGYNALQYQWEVNYQLSEFNNRYDAFDWDTPFEKGTQPPGNPYTYPDASRTSLAPDNRYQSLSFSGAYNITETTRAVLSANYGVSEQDAALLDYTNNPDANVSTPLPRDSAEAKVETLRTYLKVTSRPIKKLRMNLSYTHEERKNKTPVALWQRVVNDTLNSDEGDQASPDSDDATYNHLYDKTLDRVKLAAGYYFDKGTRFNLGYRFENLERSDRPIKESKEHSVDAGMNIGGYASPASLGIALKHDRRRISGQYDAYAEYADHYTDEYIATVNPSERFSTNPLVRQFDVSDRDRNTLDLKLDFRPTKNINVGIYGTLVKEDYPNSELGLNRNEKRGTTLDIDYSPTKALTLYGTYTKDIDVFELLGRYFDASGPPGTKANKAADPENNWTLMSEDDIDTITLGMTYRLLRNDLILKAKLYHSRESNTYSFTTGDNLTATQLPEDKANLSGAELEGDYALNEAANVRLGITYEKYESENWARDGMEPGSDDIEDMLALLSPDIDYTAYTFYAILTYKW